MTREEATLHVGMTPADLALIERIDRAEQMNQPLVLLPRDVRQLRSLMEDLQEYGRPEGWDEAFS